jgi:membrane-associated phospholipid phosphatase
MLHALTIAFVYFAYLSGAALASRRFARARGPAFVATATTGGLVAIAVSTPGAEAPPGLVGGMVIPSLVLLVGYWVSGFFFVAPQPEWERRLLAGDDAWLVRTGILRRYHAGPRLVREYFELAYLLVYVVVPAGAVVLLTNRHADALGAYWAAVLLAEFACFATLPWIQTRSPRSIEAGGAVPAGTSAVRRLNLAIARHGSIQANTFPSGHAAGSVAVALAVGHAVPAAAPVFWALAASITLATILGRYHYVADSILGVLVAVAAWGLVGIVG